MQLVMNQWNNDVNTGCRRFFVLRLRINLQKVLKNEGAKKKFTRNSPIPLSQSTSLAFPAEAYTAAEMAAFLRRLAERMATVAPDDDSSPLLSLPVTPPADG